MGKKQASTPGAPAATRNRSAKSPLAPTMGSSRPDGNFDDVSASDVYQAGVRAKTSSISANADAAYGVKGVRGRSATNASAQFRITAKLAPYSEPPAAGTMASARLMSPVMGQARNFQDDRAFTVNNG